MGGSSFHQYFLKNCYTLWCLGLILSEILFEKLLEQRDLYLNTLKHLNFQLMIDPSKEEIKDIEIMQTKTINQLKKMEQELAFLLSGKSR